MLRSLPRSGRKGLNRVPNLDEGSAKEEDLFYPNIKVGMV